VWVTPSPAVTLVSPSVLVTVRSDEAVTVVSSEAPVSPVLVPSTATETVLVWSPSVELGTV